MDALQNKIQNLTSIHPNLSQSNTVYLRENMALQAETSCPLYRYNFWSNKCTVTYGRTEVLKSMSILTGCIYVSDLLYHYVMYHDTNTVSYIYIYIICLSIYYHSIFFRRQAEASYLLKTLTFSRACKYRNFLQHCSEDCAVHQPKESKQRIQPQHVPSTSATTYHQPPKKNWQLLRSKHWTEEHSHFGIQFLQNGKYQCSVGFPLKWYEFGITKHPADNPCESSMFSKSFEIDWNLTPLQGRWASAPLNIALPIVTKWQMQWLAKWMIPTMHR